MLCRVAALKIFRSFEISKNIQSIKIARLEPSLKQWFNILIPLRNLSMIETYLVKYLKLKNDYLAIKNH